jgi:hypothetical protein
LFNSTINFFPPVHRPPDATPSTYRWKCSTAPPCSTPFESIPFGRKIGFSRGSWSQDCSSTGPEGVLGQSPRAARIDTMQHAADVV